MSFDEQIRDLIDHAPQDGVTPALIEAIAPILREFASRLRHLQYYIVRSVDQNWLVNYISRADQTGDATVIYAFANLKDVATGPNSLRDPQLMAVPIPVTHLLFQMIAMEGIDSMIFFEVPGNTQTGTQINRADLQAMIEAQLNVKVVPRVVPPDIA